MLSVDYQQELLASNLGARDSVLVVILSSQFWDAFISTSPSTPARLRLRKGGYKWAQRHRGED